MKKSVTYFTRYTHDNVKITRKGGAGLQHDNNLTGKIQHE
jgi:hypothetical protein